MEDAIKAGLIGEPVKASLLIRQPRPGFTIDPELVTMEVLAIERGPIETSRLGEPLFDE